MTNWLWVTLSMAWHGYYPAVFIKPHPDTNQFELKIESRFNPETDHYLGVALLQLGHQMVMTTDEKKNSENK